MLLSPKVKNAAVTICAVNFLSKALILKESFLNYHKDTDFYLLLIDRKSTEIESILTDVNIIWAEDLLIENFDCYAFKFDIIELSTNVKPTCLKMLLSRYEKVLYIDPDIKIYNYLQPVYDCLDTHSVVVTPHAMTPVLDGMNPSDVDFSRMGSFNLGFVGVSRCEEGIAFLDWWSERCLKLGFYEPQIGLAVDQKWVDLAPCFFPNLKVLRDLGLNVAFWNLHERILSKRDDKWYVNKDSPLYFFHFSSFSNDDPHAIAHKQSRFATGSRPDLHELLDEYAVLLKSNGESKFSSQKYSNDYFDDGTYITPALRRFYAALEDTFTDVKNPFSSNLRVYAFAIKHRLALRKFQPAQRYTFKDMDKFSSAINIINMFLRLLLRVVGPNRYFSLMKYLVHVSSIRNQRDVLK